MSDKDGWIPRDIDLNRPSPARIYDYMLGGGCNFGVDRDAAQQILQHMPWARGTAQSNRAFLHRAVRFCAQAGVRQFLDLGSGIPSVQSVHEMARQTDPSCRVVYVDNEPIAVAHGELLLAEVAGTGVIDEDLSDVDAVLGNPITRKILDFDQPIAVLLTSALHLVADDDHAAGAVARYLDTVVPGSYLVLSHATPGENEPAAAKLDNVADLTKTMTMTSRLTVRSREWIAGLFTGLDVVEPGLVYTSQWRPESLRAVDESPWRAAMLAAVARKP